ncbi:MAG: helix-turn-helix domain-containing protein [Erysipelotrichia bacterium]|nr:helix-turn-helix domain-containing protein [Erysipelotrichia bacterium]
MTQLEIIKNHLKQYHTITSMEAFQRYGITRLSATIFNLRNEGNIIDTEYQTSKNRYGEKTTYAVYKLIKMAEVNENE